MVLLSNRTQAIQQALDRLTTEDIQMSYKFRKSKV